MKKYKLPSRKRCLEILRQLCVPQRIVKHSVVTAKLAVFLAEKLKEKGIVVDVKLVDLACLLHDIARTCDFRKSSYKRFHKNIAEKDKAKWRQLKEKYKGLCHEDIACELLRKKYPELALTIKKHRYMAILDENEKPQTWEEKLVYYADKRVMHDKIVSLKERLEEAHKRNVCLHRTRAQSKINTAKVDPLIFKLENEIFSKLDLHPLEVTDEFVNKHLHIE